MSTNAVEVEQPQPQSLTDRRPVPMPVGLRLWPLAVSQSRSVPVIQVSLHNLDCLCGSRQPGCIRHWSDPAADVVVALQRVGVVQPAATPNLGPSRLRPAGFVGVVVVFVVLGGLGTLRCVDLPAPLASIDVEMWRIELRRVGIGKVPEQCVLVGPGLRPLVVAEEEAAVPRAVAVAVHVEQEAAARGPRHQHSLHGENPLVLLRRRVPVAAVQVVAKGIAARMPPRDAVRVQHRAHLEDEALPELQRARVVGQDELDEAVDGELPRRLPRVHPARKKTHRAARELERRLHRQRPVAATSQRPQHLVRQLVCGRALLHVAGALRDGQQLHVSAPGSARDRLPVEVHASAAARHVVVPVPRLEVIDVLRAPPAATPAGAEVRVVLGGGRRRIGLAGGEIGVGGHQAKFLQEGLLHLVSPAAS
mmetsp:Transcript_81985/g.232413  ORF Transcript_81985/g.232413 Transcript_81985/m.232413 type:complete len:421 (-) Transcript_81985:552-1814(-)